MAELWYGIVATMLTAYVVLDGFDLGAGLLHRVVAKSDPERRQVLSAIGPFWDGNEVWLLATGGALFVAFPRALAVGLSGFYFAIFLVLWCLILRGIAIEFRSHVGDTLWRSFWDTTFATASGLLAVCFGVALGNLLRGLPIGPTGWFVLTLFTDFGTAPPVGILDWYTVAVGLFALAALALHGAAYLAWKTAGPVAERSRTVGRRLFLIVAAGWPLLTLATLRVHADLFTTFRGRPLAWLAVATAAIGFAAAWRGLGSGGGRSMRAFLGSCAFLGGLLIATAVSMYPVLLRAVPDAMHSVTAAAAGNDAAGMRTAVGWWAVGFPLAVGYLALLFRLHRGPAAAARDGEGY